MVDIPVTADLRNDLALLTQRLERMVQSRTGSRIQDLRVEIRNDEVIITGRSPTYYAKQLATHATLGEVAPRTLVNAIDVV